MLSGIIVGRMFSTALVVVMHTSETIMVKDDEDTVLCNVTRVVWLGRFQRYGETFCLHLQSIKGVAGFTESFVRIY